MRTPRRVLVLAVTGMALLAGPLHAQRSAARWSIGIHGGADLTDEHTLKLLGAQIGYGIVRNARLQVSVTSVIEEPGTTIFALAGGQFSPSRLVFRPFAGGGLGMGYREVGPFTQTDFGWLAQAGFRLALRGVTPFAEFRLIGLTGTTSQVLVGLESRVY
jgi:hypothetical protein